MGLTGTVDRQRLNAWRAMAAGMMFFVLPVSALDANSGGNDQYKLSVGKTSMDDVARMIRQNKQWEILDARQRNKGNETRYRFKVINSTGKVKVINIDPKRPNLRKLEQ